jgi:hypothetical protein
MIQEQREREREQKREDKTVDARGYETEIARHNESR